LVYTPPKTLGYSFMNKSVFWSFSLISEFQHRYGTSTVPTSSDLPNCNINIWRHFVMEVLRIKKISDLDLDSDTYRSCSDLTLVCATLKKNCCEFFSPFSRKARNMGTILNIIQFECIFPSKKLALTKKV